MGNCDPGLKPHSPLQCLLKITNIDMAQIVAFQVRPMELRANPKELKKTTQRRLPDEAHHTHHSDTNLSKVTTVAGLGCEIMHTVAGSLSQAVETSPVLFLSYTNVRDLLAEIFGGTAQHQGM